MSKGLSTKQHEVLELLYQEHPNAVSLAPLGELYSEGARDFSTRQGAAKRALRSLKSRGLVATVVEACTLATLTPTGLTYMEQK